MRTDAIVAADLRTLIAEIQGLRAEMRDYQQKLAQSKAGFDTAIKTTEERQKAWQKNALDETLAGVVKIPSQLAQDKSLRDALVTSLKQDLPNDQAFLDALRARVAP